MKNGKITFTSWFRYFLLSLVVAGLIACSETEVNEQAKQTAQNFVNAYYAEADTASAIKYTTGLAKEKLTGELAVIKESGTNATKVEKPETTVKALSSEKLSDSEIALSWLVTAATGNKLTATTIVQKTRTDWLVSKLTENTSSED